MADNMIIMTKNGLQELQAELADLQTRRPKLVDRLSLARSMGDLSENSDYHSAKEELAFMDGRIAELEDVIRLSKVVVPNDSNAVALGHSVTVQVGNIKSVFQIVGEWEANPTKKKISNSSPLGLALTGKKVGDKIEVTAPAGKVVYTVLSIE
jgi:transcription elongation factor GreA